MLHPSPALPFFFAPLLVLVLVPPSAAHRAEWECAPGTPAATIAACASACKPPSCRAFEVDPLSGECYYLAGDSPSKHGCTRKKGVKTGFGISEAMLDLLTSEDPALPEAAAQLLIDAVGGSVQQQAAAVHTILTGDFELTPEQEAALNEAYEDAEAMLPPLVEGGPKMQEGEGGQLGQGGRPAEGGSAGGSLLSSGILVLCVVLPAVALGVGCYLLVMRHRGGGGEEEAEEEKGGGVLPPTPPSPPLPSRSDVDSLDSPLLHSFPEACRVSWNTPSNPLAQLQVVV